MGRAIAIVGNGDLSVTANRQIAVADIVVRFNKCRSSTSGHDRADTIAVCNTGRPAKDMLEDALWRDHPSVRQASSICCVRDHPTFLRARDKVLRHEPDLEDLYDDYTDGFAEFAARTGKQMWVIPGHHQDALDADLRALDPAAYVAPSTGLVMIAYVLKAFQDPDDRILVAGFSHEGWNGHPWHAERLWLNRALDPDRAHRFVRWNRSDHKSGDAAITPAWRNLLATRRTPDTAPARQLQLETGHE